MSYQVCIDIGGTFTDCLVADAEGRIEIFKSPTTPGRFHVGFINALGVAAEHYGLSQQDFIGRIELIVHGSTVSTNALVERKVSRVGLILNEGHKDILTLREGPRKGAFEWKKDFPEPYIPARLTRTVRGRIDARGRELVPLAEDQVLEAVRHFRKLEVEAIAVGLLWSVANPDHELRVKSLIAQEWADVPVTLSHHINPIPREYKRVISAAIDASIRPIVGRYIHDLQEALNEQGYGGELLLANCLGGMMPPAEMMRRPIYSVMSGPTLAPMAALALSDKPDIIVGDMGGTTFDVSALRDHRLIITHDAVIHDDALGIPKVDVRSVGAGGGSIAQVDAGGLLRVGPESAGATPGPACYGQGGTLPTVTDANVVLGIIDPQYFLGGRMAIDKDRAIAAVKRIADELHISIDEAAYTIFTTSNHGMVGAIEDITIREGINPRDSFFVCGGGATACHIAEIADILGLTSYMIPRFMAGLSAFGGLISDIRCEENGTLHASNRAFDKRAVSRLLDQLTANAKRFLDNARVSPANQRFEYLFLGRYEYQSWELEVPFHPHLGQKGGLDLEAMKEAFHQMHERVYSIRSDEETVEFTTWRVRGVGKRHNQDAWREFRLAERVGPAVPVRERELYIHGKGRCSVPVFEPGTFGAGTSLKGPCLIDAPTFSGLLHERHTGTVDEYGNITVSVEP